MLGPLDQSRKDDVAADAGNGHCDNNFRDDGRWIGVAQSLQTPIYDAEEGDHRAEGQAHDDKHFQVVCVFEQQLQNVPISVVFAIVLDLCVSARRVLGFVADEDCQQHEGD